MPAPICQVCWGDYNNDGDLDLLLIGQDKLVNGTPLTRIYQNNAGTFTAIQAGLPDIVQGKAAWGDYDNDGDLDMRVRRVASMHTPSYHAMCLPIRQSSRRSVLLE